MAPCLQGDPVAWGTVFTVSCCTLAAELMGCGVMVSPGSASSGTHHPTATAAHQGATDAVAHQDDTAAARQDDTAAAARQGATAAATHQDDTAAAHQRVTATAAHQDASQALPAGLLLTSRVKHG